ncbi:MAG: hypothetical protein JNG90_19960, partial [Planctomycetaceae bacterium]|nr:hypothetical protein [Planctomycetaceae bacterium]
MNGSTRPVVSPARTDRTLATAPPVCLPTGGHAANPPVRARALAVIPLLWLSAGAALAIDMPVARYWHGIDTPGFIVDVFESAETFGNGAGVVLILAVAVSLGGIGPRFLLRMALASLGSGLVADLFKLIIARARPREMDLQQSVLE